MQGNVLNWLGLVVDSAICGCTNGSSLPVGEKMAALWLGGPMQGNVLNWLGIVVDSAICGCKNGSSLPISLPCGLAGLCKGMF